MEEEGRLSFWLYPLFGVYLLFSQGTATFYGPYFTAGMTTASGEAYSPAAKGVAVSLENYRRLKGRWLILENLETEQSVTVKVFDTCPGCSNTMFDLPDRTWELLGRPLSAGIVPVKVWLVQDFRVRRLDLLLPIW